MRILKLLILPVVFAVVFLSATAYAQWSKINTSGIIEHLKNASVIYDPSGNRLIVYGGRNAAGEPTNGMYSLNLNSNVWSQVTQVGGPIPSPRYTHNAYYDINSNSMIIWSGQGISSAVYNDVWKFSFASNTWSVLWEDGNITNAPARRYGTASVYEPVSGKITTFAGFTSGGRFDDTWTFDVNSRTWQDKTTSLRPPKRCLHAAVYANDLGRMVIYGGQDTGPLDDIWECQLSSYTWSNITPAVKPPARFWNSTIYYNGGNIIIFGGLNTGPRNDMWKFRMGSNTWEFIVQGAVVPPARWGHTGIYIPEQDRMIIFGGEGDSLYKDTWQYNNVSVIGIEPISNVIPKEFSLQQNYPNPFNPVTKIRFTIPLSPPEGGNLVRLQVFDLSGKLVKTLVENNLKAGEYEVEFDSGGLSSGVYYYRLSTAGYIETKKMVLVK